jgi:hypothetical protein
MQPGRVAESRPVPALFFALLVAISGCQGGPPKTPPEIAILWRDYSAMPDQRALAIAGELRRNRWVAGAAGGRETSAEAQSIALQECQVRRQRQRMQDPCRLYAVGDEVVWGRRD